VKSSHFNKQSQSNKLSLAFILAANQPQPARKDCVFAWNNHSEASSATMHHSRVESRHQEMPDAVEHILQQARSPGQTEAFAWRIHFLDKRIQLNVMQPAGGNGRYGRIFSKVYWSQKGFQPPSTTKDGVCEAHYERGNVPEILQHSGLLPLPEEAYEFLDVQHLVFLAFSTLHLYYWFKNAPVEEECQSMTTSTLYQGIWYRQQRDTYIGRYRVHVSVKFENTSTFDSKLW
jgi:hypothetical protein